MIVIVCVDEEYGMMFHGRRQSRDRALIKDVAEECQGRMLYMNARSVPLFEEYGDIPVTVREDYMEGAGEGEYCFAEDADLRECPKGLEGVILYRWNRRYPADLRFGLDLTDGGWELVRTEEFRGFSHERITKEVYRRIRCDTRI